MWLFPDKHFLVCFVTTMKNLLQMPVLTRSIYGTFATVFLLTLLVAAILPGCQKGPSLAGTWEMDAYFINHNDASRDMKVSWVINSDGTMEQTIVYPGDLIERHEAAWTLAGDKLTIGYPHNGSTVMWTVVLLDGERLEIEHTRPGFFVERGFHRKR
jgi:hypothetical protein